MLAHGLGGAVAVKKKETALVVEMLFSV